MSSGREANAGSGILVQQVTIIIQLQADQIGGIMASLVLCVVVHGLEVSAR